MHTYMTNSASTGLHQDIHVYLPTYLQTQSSYNGEKYAQTALPMMRIEVPHMHTLHA